MNLELVSPSEVFEESLKTYRQEIIEHGESGVPFIVNFDMDDFKAFVNLLAGYSRGEGLREGFVANSTFLLIEDGKEVVGVSNLRHELTPKLEIEGGHIGYGIRPGKRKKGYATYLLQESLKEAKKLGIERALVTCDKGLRQVRRKVSLKERKS